MKNFKLLTGAAFLAGLMFTTGCVENEESESVKALRMAQASLIEAKAANETTLANAEAAYLEAQAAVEQAMADYQAAQTEIYQAREELELLMQKSEDSVTMAQNNYEIAQIQLEIDILEASEQAKLDRAIAEAERALAQSQISLESTMRDLEAEIARSEVENPTLDEYMDKYTEAVNMIESLRWDIVYQQRNIAEAQLSYDFGGASEYLMIQLAQNQRDLAKVQDWKEQYQAVYDDPSTMQTAINDAEVRLDTIQDALNDKYVQRDNLTDTYWALDYDMQVAAQDYRDAMDWSNTIEFLSGDENLYSSIYINSSVMEELINDPETSYQELSSYVQPLEYYLMSQDDLMENIDLEEEDVSIAEDRLAYVEGLKELYEADLDAAFALVEESETAVFAAQNALNEAEVELATDPTNQTLIDARDAAQDDLTAAESDLTDAESDYTNLKGDIDTAPIIENDYYWQVWSENTETIDYLIGVYEDAVGYEQDDVDDLYDDLREINAYISLVEDYIAYIEAQLGNDPEATIESLKGAYFDIKGEMEAVDSEIDLTYDDIDALQVELSYIQDFLNDMNGDYSDITSQLDNFDFNIATYTDNISDLESQIEQEDVVNQEYLANQITVLQNELANLQQELTVWEDEAAYYLELINAELGEE